MKSIGEPVPGAGGIVGSIGYEKERQSVENSALMMKTVVDELRGVDANMDNLRRDPAKPRWLY